MTFMEYTKSLNIVSEHGSIVQTIKEPAEKTMPIAEKLNNLFHAQNVFRRLNCLDNSFLPRRDKPTTLKLLVYGSIVLTIALDLALTIVQLHSCLMVHA
jgi:hypothetical protein